MKANFKCMLEIANDVFENTQNFHKIPYFFENTQNSNICNMGVKREKKRYIVRILSIFETSFAISNMHLKFAFIWHPYCRCLNFEYFRKNTVFCENFEYFRKHHLLFPTCIWNSLSFDTHISNFRILSIFEKYRIVEYC